MIQGTVFRLADEYQTFYHCFMANHKRSVAGLWQEISKTKAYKIWLRYTFEALCIRHIPETKRALGITNLYLAILSDHMQESASNESMQIVIVMDR